jgi:molybdopterin synthase catalytic subunit
MRVAVQSAPFDIGAEVAAFTAGVRGAGAVVSFTGLVRDEGGQLSGMEIEHYPGMTEKAISGMVAEAMARWSLADALVIHRHGSLRPGEAIMMVATAAPHRGDAFAAAEFLMDYLKSRAPFWKKETGAGGQSWVAAKDTDEDALKRWE